VNLRGAPVEGPVTFREAKLHSSEVALRLEGATIRGDLVLGQRFRAYGKVYLAGIEIGHDFDGEHAELNTNGEALVLDWAKIAGSVSLKGLHASGELSMLGTKIGGDFDGTEAVLAAPETRCQWIERKFQAVSSSRVCGPLA
jgi:hypothetical protein